MSLHIHTNGIAFSQYHRVAHINNGQCETIRDSFRCIRFHLPENSILGPYFEMPRAKMKVFIMFVNGFIMFPFVAEPKKLCVENTHYRN